MRAVQLVREPFHRFLTDNRLDAIVSDSFCSWSVNAAAEHGVPRLVITGTSAFARSCNESMLRRLSLFYIIDVTFVDYHFCVFKLVAFSFT
jgi:hypothetical protein